jgi:hypothetical protein
MYTVLFPSGKTLVFGIKALAETYATAYRGVLISRETVETGITPKTVGCLL